METKAETGLSKRKLDGTFADGEQVEMVGTRRRVPRAADCRRFVRRRIQTALPDLCQVLIDMALQKDMGAFKLLWQMAELDRKMPAGVGPTKKDLGFARKAMAAFRAR